MENQEQQQIDANRLLEKYTRSNFANGNGIGTGTGAALTVAYAAKSKMGICWTCQGQGVEKYLYNHMFLQRTCEKCDGEGVLHSMKEKNSTTTTTQSA
jgi:DnaJ-class molecular chaperone